MADKTHVMERSETNCVFAVSGISKHQAIAANVRFGNLLSLTRAGDHIAVSTLDFGLLGSLPRYLENILLDHIEGDPTGKLYAKVIWAGGESSQGQTIGLRCVLLDSPALPSMFSSDRPVFCVWESTVKGVTFSDFSDRQENLKKAFEFTQKHSIYPSVALRRHRENVVDANAVMIFCLVDDAWLEIGYVSASDASEIVQFAAGGACFYSRVLKLESSMLEGRPDDTYHAVYEVVGYKMSDEDAVPVGFEKLK
jgi:hypothetical protein